MEEKVILCVCNQCELCDMNMNWFIEQWEVEEALREERENNLEKC